jgi:hypothetical protein
MTLDAIRSELAHLRSERAGVRQSIESTYIRLAATPTGEAAGALKQQLDQLRAGATQLRQREIDVYGNQIEPQAMVGQLDGGIPILLVPLSIQTRFQNSPNGRTLLIRVYPDDISLERHEPRLSTSERAAGEAYWAAPETSENPNAPVRRTLWRGIVSRFDLRRAAWILRATNPEAPQAGEPLDQPVRIPAAWTLPERLVFRLYGQQDHLLTGEILGQPIPNGLEMGLDPTSPGLGFTRAGGNLDYPPELRWQSDFAEAVKVGMGIAIPLSQIGNPPRIERIVAIGVRLGDDEKQSAALLEKLIDGHRYADGFAIVPQGTPTNITDDADVPPAPDADATLAWLTGPGAYTEGGVKTLYEDECDGLRLAHALGISSEVMRYVDNADRQDGREAIAMKRALWAGTLGYYAQQMLAPLLDSRVPPVDEHLPERMILATRFFFTHFVFGRGPLPAFRVGPEPYGILPVSADTLQAGAGALPSWGDTFIDDFVKLLHDKMLILAPTWNRLSLQAPRAGAGANANARLLDVLATQASSVEWHGERLAGPEYLKAYTDFKNPGIGLNTPYNQYIAQLTKRYDEASAEFPGLFPFLPRIFELSFLGGFWRNIVDQLNQQIKSLDRGLSPLLTGDVIDNQPYSELRGIDPAYPNYIDWLSKTGFEDVRRGLTRPKPEGGVEPVTALLYMALRHSFLYEHAFLAMRLFSRFQNHPEGRPYVWTDFAEKELYNNLFAFETTYWDLVQMAKAGGWPLGGPLPAPGSVLDLIQGREALRETTPEWKTIFGDIDEVSRAVKLFADPAFPTARLERLFAEHIDLASYRLDAWAIGYVYQRLLGQRTWRQESRANRINPLRPLDNEIPLLRYDLNHHPLGPYSTGIYLGAYGWVEGIEPDPLPSRVDNLPPELTPQNGGPVTRDAKNYGLIHAPSLNQAVTAAVLRSASVTQPDTSAYNVDLSSARTRDALWIIEGVRNGQSPAALLGYRFERGLRDRDPALQQWLPQLREAFPMPRQPDTDPGAKEAIPAHDVVNGLLVIQARHDGSLNSKLSFAGADRAVMIGLADSILDTFDACGDLMLAESVHQAVQGNYQRTGSVLTAAGEFTHVPADFEVVQTPRSGTALSHRLVLAMDAPADGAALPTPRARLEPGVNQWIGSLLGPLAGISSTLTYRFEGGDAAFTITFDQLGLEPIDLLYVTDDRVESDLDGRLDLAARPLFDVAHPATPITEIVIDTSAAADAIALLNQIRGLLDSARPASLRDFVAPSALHGLDLDAIDGIDQPELIWRVLGVRVGDAAARNLASLWLAFEAMLAGLDEPVADPMKALLDAATFGVPEAVPRPPDLNAQVARVRTLLGARRDAALAKWTPFTPPAKDVLRICREVTQALLGGAFPLMPQVALPAAMAGAALPPGNPAGEQVTDWLFRASTVREGAGRLQSARTVAEELGHALAPVQVFQWPDDNKNWIALPIPDGASLTGDLVSIAVQPVGPFNAANPVAALVIDEWSETVPTRQEVTGITFHYNAPSAEPPQAVLLAVSQRSPNNNLRWTWDELVACVDQAFALARIRCVGPDQLRSTRLDPVLPATLVAESTAPATISTSWFANVSIEVAKAQHDLWRQT